jgi:hypothetical protein
MLDSNEDSTIEENAWLALRPIDPVLEDDEVVFERIPGQIRVDIFDETFFEDET